MNAAAKQEAPALPAEMLQARRWLLWKSIPNQDPTKKPRKIAYYVNGSTRGVTDTPDDYANLATYDDACKVLARGGYAGLGFALGPDGTGNHWQGVDFDDIPTRPHLQALREKAPGVVEVSPSGDGLHFIGYGRDFDTLGSNASGIEAYAKGRYFTVTEQVVGGELVDLSEFVEAALRPKHQRHAPAKPQREQIQQQPRRQDLAPLHDERKLLDDLSAALAYLKADDYGEWIDAGHALKTLGDSGRALWLEWSQSSPRFDWHEAGSKWEGFTPTETSHKAIFSKAQARGWRNPGSRQQRNAAALVDFGQTFAPLADPEMGELIDEHGEITDIVAKAPKKAVPTFPPPFRGVMADLVEKTLKASHKPQPQLSTLAALVGMAAAINGEYSTASGGRFNLYGMGVAESGTGKDKPRVMAEQVAVMGNAGILGKPGSGPGLEDAIESRRNQLVTIDEVAHLLKSVNDEKAPAHLRDIGATLLMLFSASANTYNRRVLVKSTVQQTLKTVPNPCVSLLCFSTPESIGDALTDSNCTDGLLGRLLLVPGDPEVTWRRPKCDLEMPSSVTEAVAEFKEIDPLAFAGGIQGIGSIIVQEDEGIGELLDKLGLGMEMDRRDRDHSVARSLYNRSFEKVERIAGVLAIWDNPQAPVLREDHLEWARQFVLASDAALLDFLHRHMHSGEVTKNAAKVREVLRRILAGAIKPVRPGEVEARKVPGCVARSHLLRASKLAKNDLDRTLDHMQDLGELVAATETGERLVVIHSIDMGA